MLFEFTFHNFAHTFCMVFLSGTLPYPTVLFNVFSWDYIMSNFCFCKVVFVTFLTNSLFLNSYALFILLVKPSFSACDGIRSIIFLSTAVQSLWGIFILQKELSYNVKGTYLSICSLISRGRGIRTPVSSFGDCHPAAG